MTAMTNAEKCRLYYERHKEEQQAKHRAYHRAHREEALQRHRDWYIANREDCRAKGREWDAANVVAERTRTREYARAHRERMAITNKAWRATPEGRASANAAKQRRKAALLGNPREPYDRLAVYQRDKGICHICQAPVAVMEFTLDHLVPVSQGGADAAWNVAVAHHSCNAMRGPGRLPAQLMLTGVGLT